MTESTKVLIVGGGLAGLSAAMFLAWQKTPFIMIDKHPGSSPHPKAIGFTQRTMQFLRSIGIGDEIPEIEEGFRLRRARVESLAGEMFEELPWDPDDETEDMSPFSPTRGAAVAQDLMEPVLRDKAIELGAEVRLGTEMTSFTQDENGVTAQMREREGDRTYEIRADYMIAADGAASPIREALGITRTGIGHVHTMYSTMFRPTPDLEKYLEGGILQFMVEQEGFDIFLTTYRDGRWVVYYWGEEITDPAEQTAAIRRAIGLGDIEIEIINSGTWDLTGLINDSYNEGRIFIMGDAAHTLPPTRGGWGANTGIDDANNLAWKLSSVISGKSTPALLDTYNAERQPIGTLRHDQTFSHPDHQRSAGDLANYLKGTKLFSDAAMELGQLYRSSAVIGAGPDLPAAASPVEWAGQPGTLAPHMWVEKGDERTSTIYLYFNKWTVVTEDKSWGVAAKAAQAELGIPVEVLVIGKDVKPEGDFQKTYGLASGGATLVRPDGYIGWRSANKPADAAKALTDALAAVASAAKAPARG